MKKNSPTFYFLYTIIALSFFALNSCTPTKNVVYFQDLQKDTNVPGLVDDNFELKIRKNDLLSINIISPDPISTPLFNGVQSVSSISSATPGNTGAAPSGYLVDSKGNIEIYKLGLIHVEGLTREELKKRLQRDVAPYLKDAVVTIRFLNNHVTILGEVAKPQVLNIAADKLTLFEALGMSGDITITGRKDNVLVIRETAEGKQLKRLNLTDKSIFSSPFYYLKPDDVVYVEPTETKIKNSGSAPQTVGYLLTGLSIVLTLLLNFIR